MSHGPSDLNAEERAASEREAELAARERALHSKERALDDRRRAMNERAGSLRARATDLAGKASEVGATVHEEVRSALEPHTLTAVSVPAKSERKRALEARRSAEETRAAALLAVELAVSSVEESLRHAEAELAHRETSVAALAREVIRRERSELDRREARAREMAAESRREGEERTARAREDAAREAAARKAAAPAAPAPKPQEDDGANRRIHHRLNVELDVTLSSEHNFFAGFTQNVSEGGLFIATHDTVDVGSELDITLHLQGREIKTRGRVAWLREYNVDVQDAMPGLGVEFLSLQAADHLVIQGFLRQREPLFYEA